MTAERGAADRRADGGGAVGRARGRRRPPRLQEQQRRCCCRRPAPGRRASSSPISAWPRAERLQPRRVDARRRCRARSSARPTTWRPSRSKAGAVTPATDVYALGVVIYEMVTGVRPVRRATRRSPSALQPRGRAPRPSHRGSSRPISPPAGTPRSCAAWRASRAIASRARATCVQALDASGSAAPRMHAGSRRRWSSRRWRVLAIAWRGASPGACRIRPRRPRPWPAARLRCRAGDGPRARPGGRRARVPEPRRPAGRAVAVDGARPRC